VSDDDPYDPKRLRVDPAKFATPYIPAKIRKRREQFVMLPMWWYDKLANPVPVCRTTCLIAWHLLYLDWKNRGKPFKLPNGTLRFDGISRFAKWRALTDLERRGLITIERRSRRSPVIHVHTVAMQP
jgi:hypothetical protein